MGWIKDMQIRWKHRGQPAIQEDEGDRVVSSDRRYYFENAYDNIEVVRRGVDLLVDATAEIDINITDPLNHRHAHRNNKLRKDRLINMVNHFPNDQEDINAFRRQLIMDLVLTGNCYQYWDGEFLWHLPSKLVEIKTGKRDKVEKYLYDSTTTFFPYEIIHTKDNAAKSIYAGQSKLRSARHSISTLQKMLDFQALFFENGAVPGLIFTTPNVLGRRIKERMIEDWRRLYNPKNGAKRPIILDADLKVNPLSQLSFKDLDFENSVDKHELKILKALGIPPLLLDSGNNANIRPNEQLFYNTAVLPLVSKLISSYERFFSYDMEPETVKIRALQPELREAAQYYTGLVNAGIITVNEARAKLRYDPMTGEDELRVPANIAGSAVDPNEGGRPPDSDESDEDDD